MEHADKKFAAKIEYQKGLRLFLANDLKGALRSFHLALEGNPDEKLLAAIKSYLGYTLAAVEGKDQAGLVLMKQAIQLDYTRPEHFLNLGKFYLNVQINRRHAMQVFLKGLRFCPNSQDILRMIQKMGVRRTPPLRFLPRKNLLNRLLGQILPKTKKIPRSNLIHLSLPVTILLGYLCG